ncbi:MAG: hypothetical protein LJE68_16860 [Rhodobacter sp.]|nr:hypothetical protein [Rhodobacter sp.]
MTVKITAAALLLAALPTFALAYCDEMRRKADGSLCPVDKVYDSQFDMCVEGHTQM